jgi:para-nitrobenzyl esterase
MIRLKTRMLAMLLAISSMLLAANVSNAQAVPVTGGNVEGKMLPSGITAYLGIPFAAPPVGNLRWRPPQPVVPWKDVRQAKAAPPACMQKDAHEPISEDCLYLNVWTPKDARPGVKLPVMVYIYGGGFSAGSASSPTASGVGLAGKGVIFVAGNYRVGTFGFLAHPDLDKENALGASGNYGMLDQVAVLKWTRANIARFGGDPGNVTLAGLSAGSVSTSAQHASALGKGHQRQFAYLGSWRVPQQSRCRRGWVEGAGAIGRTYDGADARLAGREDPCHTRRPAQH